MNYPDLQSAAEAAREATFNYFEKLGERPGGDLYDVAHVELIGYEPSNHSGRYDQDSGSKGPDDNQCTLHWWSYKLDYDVRFVFRVHCFAEGRHWHFYSRSSKMHVKGEVVRDSVMTYPWKKEYLASIPHEEYDILAFGQRLQTLSGPARVSVRHGGETSFVFDEKECETAAAVRQLMIDAFVEVIHEAKREVKVG